MISVDELTAKWQNLRKIAFNTQAVDVEHPLGWRIGYDAKLQRAVYLHSHYKSKNLESSDAFDVVQTEQDGGNWLMIISLEKSELEETYDAICADLIEYTSKAESEKEAFSRLERRYSQWLRLLKRRSKSLLSSEEQRGLLGELLFLEQLLGGEDGEEEPCYVKIVNSWVGPEQEHQDFYFSDKWYEVKTVKEGRGKVTISSLEQLSPTGTGELVVFTLRKTSHGVMSVSLNEQVDRVKDILAADLVAVDLFEDKLLVAGYVYNRAYDDPAYYVCEESHYEVKADFPRLLHENIPAAVLQASYDLSVLGLEDWKKQ